MAVSTTTERAPEEAIHCLVVAPAGRAEGGALAEVEAEPSEKSRRESCIEREQNIEHYAYNVAVDNLVLCELKHGTITLKCPLQARRVSHRRPWCVFAQKSASDF